jgi:hypothetical protein
LNVLNVRPELQGKRIFNMNSPVRLDSFFRENRSHNVFFIRNRLFPVIRILGQSLFHLIGDEFRQSMMGCQDDKDLERALVPSAAIRAIIGFISELGCGKAGGARLRGK